VRKFICSACGTVFCSRKNTVFYGLRTSPEKITLALDLSTKGLSVNKIAEVVKGLSSDGQKMDWESSKPLRKSQ